MSKQILLIDDDEDGLYFFTEALQEMKNPFACIADKSVEEGIKMLKQLSPDFILLDINMPGINGFEGLSLFRKLDLRQTPVILYSTAIDEVFIQRGLSQGATACVRKGNYVKDLVDILQGIFSQGSPGKGNGSTFPGRKQRTISSQNC